MKSQTAATNYKKSLNGKIFSFALPLLRIVLGIEFLMAGIAKFGDWSAEGYLMGASGPFAEIFRSMAGNPIVDQLNIWGLVLIGIALIFGVLVRPASFFGAILMILYYFAQFETNTAHGLIEDHVIYALIFIFFMAGGAGNVFGFNGLILRNLRKPKTFTRALFS